MKLKKLMIICSVVILTALTFSCRNNSEGDSSNDTSENVLLSEENECDLPNFEETRRIDYPIGKNAKKYLNEI